MARSYRMTPARRAALRKAQAASARKRRGSGRGKARPVSSRRKRLVRAAAVGAAVTAGGVVAYHGGKRVKRHRSEQFRKDVRSGVYHRVRTHQTSSIRILRLDKQGKHRLTPKERQIHEQAARAARNQMKVRTSKRRAMSTKQRRHSVSTGKRKRKH